MKGFVAMVKELSDLAGQHEQVAESLVTIIVKDMQTSVQEVKQERKRVNEGICLRSLMCFKIVILWHWLLITLRAKLRRGVL